jgi:cytochrome c-type biogenesis protein
MAHTVLIKQSFPRTILWPLLLFTLAIGTAVVGALLTGSDVGLLNSRVEAASASSNNWLSNISTALPLGFAFGAGMVSSVNACGFAMLPAYLGLYLGDQKATQRERNSLERLRRAMLVGSVVTLGFILLFGLVGIAISAGARPLIRFFPWIGLSIGVLLALAGAYMIAGGSLYTGLAEWLSERMGDARQRGVRGYFAFGLGYGTASLSCTLPVFLTVVGSTFTVSTFMNSALQFVLYGLGMGLVILALTLSISVFQNALVGKVRKVLPYIQPVSAVLLLMAGAYILYYWLTLGRDLLVS